jgi:hypothetical protein
MRHSANEILAHLDEVCRAIIQAGREPDNQAPKPSVPSVQSEIEAFLVGSPASGENAYANHVARGMAKVRERGVG